MRSTLLVIVAILGAGVAEAAGKDAPTAQLEQLYAEFWEENLALNPLRATFVGDPRYNDRLPNFLSSDYQRTMREFQQRYLNRARAVGSDDLAGQARLSYEIFLRDRAMALEGMQFPDRLQPIDQFGSVASLIAQLGSGTNAQPFVTVADYDNWLRRAGQVPTLFDQAIANMREGIAQGVVQPRVLMVKVLPQLDALIVDEPEKSVFWGPIDMLPEGFSAADRVRLTAAYRALVSDVLMPSYRKLRAFIADEYLPRTRATVGLDALPNGQAWYAYQVRDNTTTNLTPAEIHVIGLAEVARIHADMREVATQLGYPAQDGEVDLAGFFRWMKDRPDMYFASREELLQSFRAFRTQIDPLLPQYFNLRPRAEYEIRTYEPFREASAAAGSYQGPSQDGTRAGIFYVNAFDLKARPRWTRNSLALHEAAPGHHFQIALQQELSSLPMFRRFGGETAFAEGWGLYAEHLGYEMGAYEDPVQHFGALDAELWRAIRLVVDTGLHSKGWSRQQVLDYMYANSPVEPTRAIAEAERFMAMPGQALAYKIGQLKILELRKLAEAQLGERFDIRAFHDEVLRDGSVPLEVLEEKIARWLAAQVSKFEK
ncbi:MAG TPA: DUF885 family protein [Steroidobacteraceae bacterium]|nr:DUF885 family protein [Steroidobacteraceae bacterium]